MPHAPMRAGLAGEVAACASIAGPSGCLAVVAGVEEQAVSAVTSAADTAVPAATKCFDMKLVFLAQRAGATAVGCRAFCGFYAGTRQMATANRIQPAINASPPNGGSTWMNRGAPSDAAYSAPENSTIP